MICCYSFWIVTSLALLFFMIIIWNDSVIKGSKNFSGRRETTTSTHNALFICILIFPSIGMQQVFENSEKLRGARD